MAWKILFQVVKLVSRLPLWFWYRISDVLFVLLFYVFQYRKNVVQQNLSRAFPDHSSKQNERIAGRFYRHLCDLLVESIKFISISPQQLQKRIQFSSTEIFAQYFAKEQKIIVLMGHCGNWEWSSACMSLSTPYQLNALFQPIKHEATNHWLKNIRSRFGANLVPRKQAYRFMLREPKSTISATTFIADQTPYIMQGVVWKEFLHQDTPFLTGYAHLARKLNYPVIFVNVRKMQRGKYLIDAKRLFALPKEHSIEEIVGAFGAALEREIKAQPFNWLWSHRRWKRSREKEIDTKYQ